MKTLIAVTIVASQLSYYEAKVTTFGCNSIDEVHHLQSMRSDRKAFQMAMIAKQFDGQCVTILKGTVVEGSPEDSDSAILRVNRQSDPPGYKAPFDDFEIKAKTSSSWSAARQR